MKIQYKLQYPVGTITEIEISRPKARDIKDFGANGNYGAKDQINLIHRLTGLTPNLVEEMDIADFTEVGRIIAEMFPKQPEE